jgi:hypothetical protein
MVTPFKRNRYRIHLMYSLSVDAHLRWHRLLKKYCGVFTPCKNCNIETRSHEYATVEEVVFSPSGVEPNRAVTSRASHSIVSYRFSSFVARKQL